jgi:hypothetical protein
MSSPRDSTPRRSGRASQLRAAANQPLESSPLKYPTSPVSGGLNDENTNPNAQQQPPSSSTGRLFPSTARSTNLSMRGTRTADAVSGMSC